MLLLLCRIECCGGFGRFGRKGVAINFVTDDDRRNLHYIEKYMFSRQIEMPFS